MAMIVREICPRKGRFLVCNAECCIAVVGVGTVSEEDPLSLCACERGCESVFVCVCVYGDDSERNMRMEGSLSCVQC